MSAPTPTGEKIEIRSSTGQRLGDAIQKEAGKSESEASKHINNINNDKDKKNALKVIGAGVALAVVVVGGYRWHQHHKSEKDKAAEEAENVLNKAGRKVKQGANWFGNKAEDVGHKAGEVTEVHVQPAVSAATEQVVSAAGSVKDTVSDATQGIRDKARIEGLKAEKEGVKASEKSDNAVRSTFDKVAKEAGKAKDKVKDVGKDGKHEGGNVFHAIGNWFSDRKDDVGDAANAVKGKTHEVLDN